MVSWGKNPCDFLLSIMSSWLLGKKHIPVWLRTDLKKQREESKLVNKCFENIIEASDFQDDKSSLVIEHWFSGKARVTLGNRKMIS